MFAYLDTKFTEEKKSPILLTVVSKSSNMSKSFVFSGRHPNVQGRWCFLVPFLLGKRIGSQNNLGYLGSREGYQLEPLCFEKSFEHSLKQVFSFALGACW